MPITPAILKIKRVFAYTIYNNLRNVPPKNYPTTAEIKSTISDILPYLKAEVSEYADMLKKAEELNLKLMTKEITKEESDKKIEKINEQWRVYNREHGSEEVSITLSDEAFTTLSTQFNRDGWGKNWVQTIEEFGELEAAFTAAGKK